MPKSQAKAVKLFVLATFMLMFSLAGSPPLTAQENSEIAHLVLPGDTWPALSRRFGIPESTLRDLSPHPNRWREPTIGQTLILPNPQSEQFGRLVRSHHGGLWTLAAQTGTNPWALAVANRHLHPGRPLLGQPIILPGVETIRDYPPGLRSLAVSHIPAKAGELMAYSGEIEFSNLAGRTSLGSSDGSLFVNPELNRVVGILATGAFFRPLAPELTIAIEGQPIWTQPWQFQDKEWTFNQITLTGQAANISQEAIRQERARLFELWAVQSPRPIWQTPFSEPVDSYLSYSSLYGARRSYNGGPYSTYHEGLDFAAYGGTPVYAPAAGTVVLAEELYVRGGAVIIDHGLGIYTGYYHLSEVLIENGSFIEADQLIGEVGTTGLSTGNHLHWDLLANGIWVDPFAFREGKLGCWILEGWGTPCPNDLP